MNSSIIDVIFAIFFIFMAIIGYIKGFITRLYDLITTILVVFLAHLLASPLASLFKIYAYQETDAIAIMMGQMINRILIFVLLLIGLMIIKKIIGLFMKPILRSVTHTFHLTKWVDQSLGALLGMAESILLTYIVLVFIYIPFFHGTDTLEDTLLAKHVLNIVPDISEQVIDLSAEMENPKDYSLTALTKIILFAKDLDLIDQQQTTMLFKEHIQKQLETENISLSPKQIDQILEILKESHYSSDQIETILSKINVSDE